MQDRKFDRGLIDNEVLRKLCSEKTEPKSALKKVESDLVEPNSDLARGPHSEGGTEACDVRSTFVAEVTYKQVVFPRGAEAGQAGQGERGGGGDQGAGGGEEVQGGGEGGGGEEVIPGEEILSEREKAEQVRCVELIILMRESLFLLLADGY